MKIYKNAGLIVFTIFIVSSVAIIGPQAKAGTYNFSYHSNPNSNENCSWVYQWKWVYGKKVRVKLKVCN